MNRTEITAILAASLVAAFILGWALRWVFARLNRSSLQGGPPEEMAALLHAAEEARDTAEERMNQRETELQNQLTQTKAELAAAMEGLGDARRRSQDLESELLEYRDAYSPTK